jgi:Ca2+-binding EF-hand superfamily protein
MINNKSFELSNGIESIDILFLGLSDVEIRTWHEKFFENNSDGRLDRAEFRRLFSLLRQESVDRLEKICDHAFRAFDVDGNGYVEFGEFLLGFAICSRGNLRARLSYAFECYDLDSNGYITEGKTLPVCSTIIDDVISCSLTVDELAPVLEGMYTLLGIQHVEDYPPDAVAKDLMKKLDTSNDGRVTKDEFINFLTKDGIYRNTVNPFH